MQQNGPLAKRVPQPPGRRLRQDEAVELEGQPALVSQGMKGRVLSLHDGFHLDVIPGGSVLPKAIVEFENGMRLMVDERMKWERVTD